MIDRRLVSAARLGMVLSSLMLAVVGCSSAGRIEFSSLNYRAIDPPAARTFKLDLDACYWWEDDQGEVWIAMTRELRSLIGPVADSEMQITLRLERLPAGQARNYLASKKELRARIRFGPTENRFTSVAGIVALYREPGNRLRGSLRLDAARVASSILGGWGRPTRYLMQGTFTALHDPVRGGPIRASTESSGWGHDESTTQPAPQ